MGGKQHVDLQLVVRVCLYALCYACGCWGLGLYTLLVSAALGLALCCWEQGGQQVELLNFHINIHNIWKNASCTKSLISISNFKNIFKHFYKQTFKPENCWL